MGECLILKRGGGISSDDLTSTRAQVLAGYTAVTKDSDDEATEGTMPNNPAMDATLNAGQSKVIPAGYTPGGTVTANSLASQTQANAIAANLTNGKTAWVNGKQITGTGADNQSFYNNGYSTGFAEGQASLKSATYTYNARLPENKQFTYNTGHQLVAVNGRMQNCIVYKWQQSYNAYIQAGDFHVEFSGTNFTIYFPGAAVDHDQNTVVVVTYWYFN